jgi:SHS2 domain-containing protein
MPFEFLDHAGDLGVRITGRSIEELFAAGAEALTETLTDRATVLSRLSVPVALEAPRLDLLLVDWMNELVYQFDVHAMLVCDVDVAVTRGAERCRLQAIVHGERLALGRHPIKTLVKAVTYHALAVVETPDGWRATLVFDL